LHFNLSVSVLRPNCNLRCYDSQSHRFHEAHINRPKPGDLDLSPFDLKIGSRVTRGFSLLVATYYWASTMPILGFLRLSILELGRGTRQMDRQTDNRAQFTMPPSPTGGIIILRRGIWNSILADELFTEQGNFKKIVIPSTYMWFCYLFNGICFHFRLCVTGIPADLRMMHCL